MNEKIALGLNDLTLVQGEDEPRILDETLAERLGFERPRAIRQIIERNLGELEKFGATPHCVASPAGGGHTFKQYYLSEPQALVICMKSETERAADVRKEIIDVFMACRRARLIQPVPAADAALGAIHDSLTKIDRKIDQRFDDLGENVVRIDQNVRGIVKRREFGDEVKRQFCAALLKLNGGHCCCCLAARRTRIVADDGKPVPGVLVFDHFNGRNRNKAADGWPTCKDCNQKFESDPGFRDGHRATFQVFQNHRGELFDRPARRPRSAAPQAGVKIYSSVDLGLVNATQMAFPLDPRKKNP